jgi:archaellin
VFLAVIVVGAVAAAVLAGGAQFTLSALAQELGLVR